MLFEAVYKWNYVTDSCLPLDFFGGSPSVGPGARVVIPSTSIIRRRSVLINKGESSDSFTSLFIVFFQ